jgi:hypothetical protein
MGRVRSCSSLVRAWLVAVCAAGLVAAVLPMQLAGAAGDDPGRDRPPVRVPSDDSGGLGGGGTGGTGGETEPTAESSPAVSDLSIVKAALRTR